MFGWKPCPNGYIFSFYFILEIIKLSLSAAFSNTFDNLWKLLKSTCPMADILIKRQSKMKNSSFNPEILQTIIRHKKIRRTQLDSIN